MCFGCSKERLTEKVLLSTHNICFGLEIRKIIFQYTLLSGGLFCKGCENLVNIFFSCKKFYTGIKMLSYPVPPSSNVRQKLGTKLFVDPRTQNNITGSEVGLRLRMNSLYHLFYFQCCLTTCLSTKTLLIWEENLKKSGMLIMIF